MSDRLALIKAAELYETPQWAIESILRAELLTPEVIDPCCGRGVLSIAAQEAGYKVTAFDKYDWGYGIRGVDFLDDFGLASFEYAGKTVLMNPPFSRAVEFVETALQRGARKIVCFQRMAWRESLTRRDFWHDNPPNRVYLCGERAVCWRLDLAEQPEKIRGKSSPTPHAWFVWEAGQPRGELLTTLWKGHPETIAAGNAQGNAQNRDVEKVERRVTS